MSFDLHSFVQSVRANLDSADPSDLADAVLAELPAKQLRAALSQALPTYCSTVITSSRQRPTSPIGSAIASAPPTEAAPSRWGSAFADAYPWLDRDYCGADRWKLLGDFTREDAEAAAATRFARAAAMTATGEWFASLAKALADAGVAKTSALPKSVLDQLGDPDERTTD